jgi:hypothetical protein
MTPEGARAAAAAGGQSNGGGCGTGIVGMDQAWGTVEMFCPLIGGNRVNNIKWERKLVQKK